MDIINLLPSPPQVLRLALSLLNSTVIGNHRRACDGRSAPIDLDVDDETGFFPRKPLPRLPKTFEIWENALTEAAGALSLGEDDSEEAVGKREAGEKWRAVVRSVSCYFSSDLASADDSPVAGPQYGRSMRESTPSSKGTSGARLAREFFCTLNPAS